jgi:hypothetical protein
VPGKLRVSSAAPAPNSGSLRASMTKRKIINKRVLSACNHPREPAPNFLESLDRQIEYRNNILDHKVWVKHKKLQQMKSDLVYLKGDQSNDIQNAFVFKQDSSIRALLDKRKRESLL